MYHITARTEALREGGERMKITIEISAKEIADLLHCAEDRPTMEDVKQEGFKALAAELRKHHVPFDAHTHEEP